MCVPVMAAVAIAGMAMQAYSTHQQGKQASATAKHQGAVAEFNAKVGENNAIAATQAAEFERDLFDENFKRRLSANTVATAASGVQINTGSADLVQTESLQNAALERLSILYNGQVAANAARSGAVIDRASGAASRANAAALRSAGNINTLSSIGQSAFKVQQQGLLA
jgi:hypothetical protein